MSELKTIKFPGDGEPRVIVDGAAVHFDKPQALHPEMQAQARANIGAVCDYYSTTREELAVTLGKEDAVYADVICKTIWDLYDALMEDYPGRVRKNPIYNDDGSFTNYEYVVSNRDYNEAIGAFKSKDDHIKKPKYLVACGIHGWEKASILSTYRLFRDIVTGHNVPTHFKEGCVIHFLPIGNPWSLDNDTWSNEAGVNINRNFDWNWNVNLKEDPKSKPGTGGNSEKETQAIVNWLKANKDAQLFLDCHNVSPGDNEIVTFVGLKDSKEYDREKKIAMRGVDRVVPFWKDVIGYADDTIFRNSSGIGEGGISIFYAAETSDTKDWHIPSLNLELSVRPTGTETTSKNLDPETIAVAAEVIGNVLLEFYEQYSMGEVVDMTETNEKLDGLAEGVTKTGGKIDALSASMSGDMAAIKAKLDALLSGTEEPAEPVEPSNGFRVETGVYEEPEDTKSATALIINCPAKPKIVVVVADDKEVVVDNKTTYGSILASTGAQYLVGLVGQRLIQLPNGTNKTEKYWSYMSTMSGDNTDAYPSNGFTMLRDTKEDGSEGEGVVIGATMKKKGFYNWTAYYWND